MNQKNKCMTDIHGVRQFLPSNQSTATPSQVQRQRDPLNGNEHRLYSILSGNRYVESGTWSRKGISRRDRSHVEWCFLQPSRRGRKNVKVSERKRKSRNVPIPHAHRSFAVNNTVTLYPHANWIIFVSRNFTFSINFGNNWVWRSSWPNWPRFELPHV